MRRERAKERNDFSTMEPSLPWNQDAKKSPKSCWGETSRVHADPLHRHRRQHTRSPLQFPARLFPLAASCSLPPPLSRDSSQHARARVLVPARSCRSPQNLCLQVSLESVEVHYLIPSPSVIYPQSIPNLGEHESVEEESELKFSASHRPSRTQSCWIC